MMRVVSTAAHLLLGWSLLQQAEAAASFEAAVTSSSSSSNNYIDSLPRFLEDNNAAYSGNYHLIFDKCIRVKIPKNNDDDGNSYFYNGAYRSQSMAFASFFLCPSNNGCSAQSCDTSTAYVTDLEDYLQAYVQHLQNYCTACQEKCRRRRLDQNGGYNININCYECTDQCSMLNNNNNNNNNNGDVKDESQYLECQQAYKDENGIAYYSAPTCSSKGGLEMGLFYDEDCTIKKSDDESGFRDTFGYKTFQTVEGWCTYCDNDENNDGGDDDVCNADGGFMQDAYQCVDGRNVNENVDGDDEEAEMQICKTYKKVSKEWSYAQAKKKSPWPIIILVLVLVNIFLFLSYTYYVRHVKTAEQIAAAANGGGTTTSSNNNIDPSSGAIDPSDDEPKAAYAVMT